MGIYPVIGAYSMEKIIQGIPEGYWRDLATTHPEGLPLLLQIFTDRGGTETYIPHANVARREAETPEAGNVMKK